LIESNEGLVTEFKRYAARAACVDNVVATEGFFLNDPLPAVFIATAGLYEALKGDGPGGPLGAFFCMGI